MLKTAAKQYKFVLVGDSAVGKSSLLNRFVDKSFSQSLLSTIGVDFKFKKVRIDNNDIKLQIWDTAGQQTFRSIVSAYYTSADAIVIVYDITSYESFQNIKSYWIQEAENNNKNNARIFLIGNKIDEDSRRQVQKFTLEAFMEQHSLDGHYEASAKTGLNVEQSFTDITRTLYFGLKPKSNNIANRVSTEPNRLSKVQTKKSSFHQRVQNQKNFEETPEQYEQVISVDDQTRRNDEKVNQQKIKINNMAPKKSKNPNYNKSCCLK